MLDFVLNKLEVTREDQATLLKQTKEDWDFTDTEMTPKFEKITHKQCVECLKMLLVLRTGSEDAFEGLKH